MIGPIHSNRFAMMHVPSFAGVKKGKVLANINDMYISEHMPEARDARAADLTRCGTICYPR